MNTVNFQGNDKLNSAETVYDTEDDSPSDTDFDQLAAKPKVNVNKIERFKKYQKSNCLNVRHLTTILLIHRGKGSKVKRDINFSTDIVHDVRA